MSEDGSKLNETEKQVRDALKKSLGSRATIVEVKEEKDGRVVVRIVSPNDFSWTSDTLAQVGPEIAKTVKSGIEINLTTWWQSK